MISLVFPLCFHFYDLLFTHVILYRSPFKPATLNWNFCINNVYKQINKYVSEFKFKIAISIYFSKAITDL